MLEPPALAVADIASCLQEDYALLVRQFDFLPLGADPGTAVYRVITHEGATYFLKLRRGPFDPLTLRFPAWLEDLSVAHVIAPLRTEAGPLYTTLQEFTVALYPFIEGRNAYEVALSETQWASFGTVLRKLHTAKVPDELLRSFRRETFSAEWREAVARILARVEHERFDEPIAREAAAFLHARREQVAGLVGRTDKLGHALGAQTLDFVACHGDLHAGNLHIGLDGTLYLVDWDNLTLAPKERDLMFIGAGLLGEHCGPEAEGVLFYRGYGETERDPDAVAYYRYERIIQDIAVFCKELLSDGNIEDRRQSLAYLKGNFLPGGTVEQAYRVDGTLTRPSSAK